MAKHEAEYSAVTSLSLCALFVGGIVAASTGNWWIFVGVAASLVFALVGVYVARQCGRSPFEGWLLGGFGGPVGLLLLALMPRGGT